MATIVSVEACTAEVPLDTPVAFSTRAVRSRYYTLVRVRDEDGCAGIGFCYAGNHAGHLVTVAMLDLLAPMVLGKDPYLVERLWEDCYQEALLQGRTGAAMRALSALDTALWDHNARAVSLPLAHYLGGYRADPVPAYASGGYYREGDDEAALADELRGYVQAGFEAVKIKVGRLDARREERRVAAARDAVGPDVLLMLDANNAWRDLPTALRTLQRLEQYDPYWIEEPFSPDDIESHAGLARRLAMPVATGEIEAGRWRHKVLLDRGAAAILQTDVAVCGGISEFRRIAGLAAAHGVVMCPHWFHDLHAPVVASTPNAGFVEYFPDDRVLNFRRLIDRQLAVDGGRLVLHREPGLGFEFDDAAVVRYAPDGWQRRTVG